MTFLSFGSFRFVSCFACLLAYGCGEGATHSIPSSAANVHADSPAPLSENGPKNGAEAHAAEPSGTPATSAASSVAATPEAPPDPVITRTLSERVFAPRIAYMVNYPLSGARETAERKCAIKFPEAEGKAACIEKERDKFGADVLVFEKSEGTQTLTIYKRSGNALSELSRSRVQLGEDTPDRLSIKVESDKGWRPLFAGQKVFELRHRDEYSIELDDPRLGQLVYDARIGLLD
jgi:hypothetical protein